MKTKRILLIAALLSLALGQLACSFNIGDLLGSNGGGTSGSGALLEDDFSDEDSGWEVFTYDDGSYVGYENGSYAVATTGGAGSWSYGLAMRNFDDIVLDVDATQVSGPTDDNNGYGVMCRAQENGDGYLFAISGDGYYSIWAISNGEFLDLVDWAESGSIAQGDSKNHLRVVCDGSHLALYVNNQLIGEAQDSSFASGDIGFAAASYTDEGTLIYFDNLVVTAP
jgi:hypothetical protein